MRLSLICSVLVAVGAVACGSSDSAPLQHHGSNTPTPNDQDTAPPGPNDTKPPGDPGTPPPVGTPEPPGTWADGHVVSGNINIPAGTTVTIAAGAQIKIAPDASITVAGVL